MGGNDFLKGALLRGNYVTAEDMRVAEELAEKQGCSLSEALISKNLLTRDLLGQAMAEAFGISYADLNSNVPSKELVLKVPEAVAREYRIVLFMEGESGVVVATDDPAREDLSGVLGGLFPGKNVSIAYGLPEDIEAAFGYYRKSLETRFSKILEGKERVVPEVLGEIFDDALIFRASDIHFEPQGQEVSVRFRVDGVLHEAGKIPANFYENIVNRIKVQSGLRIDEHFSAQDGSMRYEKDGVVFDMRASVVPTVEGEKVVLRILSSYVGGLSLGDLGLSEYGQEILKESGRKPFGMILIAGPTGSGKTTTLYALLKTINEPDVNIMTIEDPVEYKIRGINQILVNPQTNLTFSKGLRSIVRQDPDVILVGEIRDDETAEIATNAALTGHLLLSTFHANDAATAIPRLLDMAVEPFILSSTLEIIVAQRLVRKICEHCRYGFEFTQDGMGNKFREIPRFFGKRPTVYRGKGCVACGYTGYSGRTALFEFVRMTPEMKDLVLTHPSSKQIWELATKQGSRSLFEDGIDRAKNGVITIDELFRVAAPPRVSDR